jgi:hypothetical protein
MTGRDSAHLLKSAALTVALLLAAAALWVYTDSSDPSGGAPAAGRSREAMADLTLPPAEAQAGDRPGRGRAHAGSAARRRGAAISGLVTPITPAIDSPVPVGGPSFARDVAHQPLTSSPAPSWPVPPPPVAERPRRPVTHPRTLPRRSPPKPRVPAEPAPAPSPRPRQPPSSDPPTGGAPSDPGAPGATPTDPGIAPTPVPVADPEAPLDDTPVGGLDPGDLGGPVDEAPDAPPAPAPQGGTT